MPWSASWEVTDGNRGARHGDGRNRVYQNEHVRFTLHLSDEGPQAPSFVRDPRNWRVLPKMHITGFNPDGSPIRTVTVEAARGSLLDFDYHFRWAGDKRIAFLGEIDLHRAEGAIHGNMGARAATMRAPASPEDERHPADVYDTYPPLSLSMPFEVIEETTEGGASATTSGGGRSAEARERRIEHERRAAGRERAADEAAESADRAGRRRRAMAARRGTRPGIVRMPSPWPRLLDGVEFDALDDYAMDEYARDLKAAIAATEAISMDGVFYRHGDHTYRGYWTSAREDGDIVFYFQASQISTGFGDMRVCDSSEAERVRRHSSENRRYGFDEVVLGIVPGSSQKVLLTASAFAQDVSWERLMAMFNAVDYVLTAFDVVAVATGAGAIFAGIQKAAFWLVRNAGRVARRALAAAARHPDDIGRVAGRVLAHADDATRSSRELARGVGGVTTASGDDLARGLAPEGSGSIDEARGLADEATGSTDEARGLARSADEAGDEARGVADGAPSADDSAHAADDAAELDADVDAAFDAMTSGARRGAPVRAAAPDPYVATAQAWREFRRARDEFRSLQREYARRLGLRARSGAQVHHAIELNVIARYGDDIFTVDELNRIWNMRGIVPERTSAGVMSTRYGLRQLHNSAIRRRWDEIYENINRMIADEGLLPGTGAYRTRVRAELLAGRANIDREFGALFSGSGARLDREFISELRDAARRGGRSGVRWTPGMLTRDLESIDDAVPGGVELDPPPALRAP